MINPNGLYRHVPSHAFELALALIFKTGSTLLVHHWQPGGLELDNHCLYDRHCQYTLRLLFSLFFLLASSKRRNRACRNRACLYVRTLYWNGQLVWTPALSTLFVGVCIQRELSPTSGYTGISARRRYAMFFYLQSVPTRSLSTLVG